MLKAVYPGSFDPLTNGHVYIAKRAADIFGKCVIAVLDNSEKKSMFTKKERLEMIREVFKNDKNITAAAFDGLLVEFMKKEKSRVIVRGLRALSDFEYEFQIAQLNRQLAPEVETFFIATEPRFSFLASHAVKDVFKWGGNIADMVPEEILKRMNAAKNKN